MITTDDFCRAFYRFTAQHGLLDATSGKDPVYVNKLLRDPIIHAFLARPVDEVQFSNNHPMLSFEELLIYRYTKRFFRDSSGYYKPHSWVPFRDERISTKEFYSSGTLNFPLEALTREDVADNPDIAASFNSLHMVDKVVVDAYHDLRRLVGLESSEHAFELFAISGSGHTATGLRVLDKSTHYVLAHILINSDPSPGWSAAPLRHETNSFNLQELIKGYDLGLDLGGERIGGDPLLIAALDEYAKQHFGYSIDELPKNRKIPGTKGVMYDGTKEKIADSIHVLFGQDRWLESISITLRRPGLVEIPCHLQERGDYNCVLFTRNIIIALTHFLKDPSRSERVIDLCHALWGSPAEKNKAEQELQQLFGRDLRSFLPQYYESETGAYKNRTDINRYHLEERWRLGSRFVTKHFSLSDIDQEQLCEFQKANRQFEGILKELSEIHMHFGSASQVKKIRKKHEYFFSSLQESSNPFIQDKLNVLTQAFERKEIELLAIAQETKIKRDTLINSDKLSQLDESLSERYHKMIWDEYQKIIRIQTAFYLLSGGLITLGVALCFSGTPVLGVSCLLSGIGLFAIASEKDHISGLVAWTRAKP